MHRPQSHAESPPPVRLWLRTHGRQALVLAVLYFVFGHASFLVQVDDVLVTPVLFAPEGIALAMALRFGAAVWPGVFAGQLVLALSSGLAPWPAVSIAAVNSLEVVLAVFLFRAFKLDATLPRARDLAGLLLVVIFVLQPFSATLGNATLWAGGIVERADLPASWLNWWIGNSLGQMLITPMLLAIFADGRSWLERTGDFVLTALIMTPALALAAKLWIWSENPSLIFLFVPVLVVLAIYGGLVSVCVAALIVALGALYATSHAFGPFVTDGEADILDLNLFLIGLTLTGQFLAVFLRQLRRQQDVESELQATRARLQNTAFELTENIPVGTYTLVQPQGGGVPYLSFMSRRFLALTGIERETARENLLNAFTCVHPEDYDVWLAKNTEALERKLPFNEECRILLAGEIRWIKAESTPRTMPDGSVMWEGVLADITARKQVEQKLAASEAGLQRILDNLPIPVAINKAETDAGITFLNRQFTETFGYTLEDIPTVPDWARLAYPDEDYRAATFAIWNAAVKKAASTGGSIEPMEFRVSGKDGARRDVVINAVALDDMLIVGFVDITERKRAQEEIATVNRNMQLAASAARLGFWEYNMETGLARRDEEMADIHGIKLSDFDGHWEKYVYPDDYEAVMSEVQRILERDKSFEIGWRIVRPTGEIRHVHEHGIVLRDSLGRALSARGVMRDITEEKEAATREKQLEEGHRRDLQNKLKTSLTAAAVAYEINQPLSTILLQSKMALQQKSDPYEALGVVAEAAQRVVATIEKMKTLLRNVQTKHGPIDLAAVAQGALLYKKPLLRKARVSVTSEGLDEACPATGDGAQLQLALINILRNAIEALAEAKPKRREILVKLTVGTDGPELSIGDSGAGWPEDGPADIPLSSTKQDGTGIGLYVVRTAMQNHGGTVTFGRSPLGGAEVRLKFPRPEKNLATAESSRQPEEN